MTIEYTLTKEDLFNFIFYVGWASPEKKNYRVKYYLKSILWPLVAVLFVITTANKKLDIKIIFTCVALGLFVGFIAAYIGINSIYRRKIEKLTEDPNNSNFLTRNQLLLDDSGIKNIDEYSETYYKWNAITKKSETKDYIYLYLSGVQGIVIPKRVLNTMEEKNLRELLNRNLSLKAEFNELYV